MRSFLDVFSGLDEPGGHIVECSTALAQGGYAAHLGTLLFALKLRSHKRRIAEHEGAVFRRQKVRPIHFQGIAVQDVRRIFKRNADVALPKLQAQPVIHDMIHHPQGGLGDACRELADLDAVELIDVDP